jgi:chromosome partitioning protein
LDYLPFWLNSLANVLNWLRYQAGSGCLLPLTKNFQTILSSSAYRMGCCYGVQRSPGATMPVIAVLSRKGGVGKSTVTANLAVMARDSVIVDADPQATLADWADAREGRTPEVVCCPPPRIAATVKRQGAHWIFIDTPPSAEGSALEAAKAADFALVVTRPSQFDLNAIGDTLAILEIAGTPAAIVLNQGHHSADQSHLQASLVEQAGIPVVPVVLAYRSAYQQAAAAGQGVIEYEPQGKASGEVQRLWVWLEEQMSG